MVEVKDVLQDLVSFAVPLNFDVIRVTGSDTGTLFESVRDDRNLIMKAATTNPVSEFSGQFGMPNLKILKGYVDAFTSLQEINEKTGSNLKISVQNNYKPDPTVPTDIQFTVPSSTAIYRLRKDGLPPQLNMKENIEWDAEIVQPTKSSIAEFNTFASILAGVENHFSIKTVGSNVKFFIGDENGSVSKINMVFASGIKSKANPTARWKCSDFISIMNLAGNYDTTIRISNLGLIQVTVNTGIFIYEFSLVGGKS